MAADSKISWTHATFNPWIGCRHAPYDDSDGDAHGHPGCTNCYAEAFAKRTGKAKWGEHGTRTKTSAAYWKQPIKWNRDAERDGERRRVFCASLADVFEDWKGPVLSHTGQSLGIGPDGALCFEGDRPATMDDMRSNLFALIDKTPWLDWLILTKRPQNILKMWPAKADKRPIFPGAPGKLGEPVDCIVTQAFRENVWLLTSVSNQETANALIPHLLKCRKLAPVLGISAEPLLGPIDLRGIEHSDAHFDCLTKTCCPFDRTGKHDDDQCDGPGCNGIKLDWIIVGGESGGRRRTCAVDDIVSIVRQCQDAGVPVYVKQDAAMHPGTQGRIPDDAWSVKEYPEAQWQQSST